MLSNAYFLAKFRFDTAENEPAQNLQTVAKKKCDCSETNSDAYDILSEIVPVEVGKYEASAGGAAKGWWPIRSARFEPASVRTSVRYCLNSSSVTKPGRT